MPRTLNSITLSAPASPVSAAVNDTFDFTGTPGFSGSGGVARYDMKWEVDSGSGYVTIGSSGTGLITAGTNPLVNSNSSSANTISITCDEAGSYTIRISGAPATGGSYTVLSGTQAVEGSGAADELLADDVASASEVTAPALGQVHAILANDVQSTSEVATPAVGQVHAILADDTQSTSEVSAPAIALVTPLGANDVESAPEVTIPVIGQVHAILANDAQSASELVAPTLAQIHALIASSIESTSEIVAPGLVEYGGGDEEWSYLEEYRARAEQAIADLTAANARMTEIRAQGWKTDWSLNRANYARATDVADVYARDQDKYEALNQLFDEVIRRAHLL